MGILNLDGMMSDLKIILGGVFLVAAITAGWKLRKTRIGDLLSMFVGAVMILGILGVGAFAVDPAATKHLVVTVFPIFKG